MFSPHITTGPKVLLHALPEPKRDKKEAFLKKNSDEISGLKDFSISIKHNDNALYAEADEAIPLL